MHLHLYELCGDCATKRWHVNTENLMSGPCDAEGVAAFLASQVRDESHPKLLGYGLREIERAESGPEGRVVYDNGDIVIWQVCEGPCLHDGSQPGWKHLDTHPLVALERPEHYAVARELLGEAA